MGTSTFSATTSLTSAAGKDVAPGVATVLGLARRGEEYSRAGPGPGATTSGAVNLANSWPGYLG